MEYPASRIDRLSEQERSEAFIKLRHDSFSDGLIRIIAELPAEKRECVIRAMYKTAIVAIDENTTALKPIESIGANA